jgi:hypothetical protein
LATRIFGAAVWSMNPSQQSSLSSLSSPMMRSHRCHDRCCRRKSASVTAASATAITRFGTNIPVLAQSLSVNWSSFCLTTPPPLDLHPPGFVLLRQLDQPDRMVRSHSFRPRAMPRPRAIQYELEARSVHFRPIPHSESKPTTPAPFQHQQQRVQLVGFLLLLLVLLHPAISPCTLRHPFFHRLGGGGGRWPIGCPVPPGISKRPIGPCGETCLCLGYQTSETTIYDRVRSCRGPVESRTGQFVHGHSHASRLLKIRSVMLALM